MGSKTITFCDYCKQEFDNTPLRKQPLKLTGPRYSDAAGSMDQIILKLEMHDHCWKRFIIDCSKKAEEEYSLDEANVKINTL